MASSSNEDKKKSYLSVLELFRNVWDEVKIKNPNIGDGYVEILNRFGERKEYTAIGFWELMLQEFEDHNADFVNESQSIKETPIFTADTSSQIANTYFEKLSLGKNHWFLIQDFPSKNDILDILRLNLEVQKNDDGDEDIKLYLKLIKALENSPPKKTTPNILLKYNDDKNEKTLSAPQQNVVEPQPRSTGNRTQYNQRNNRQTRYTGRQNFIRSQYFPTIPITMPPMMQSVPYNPHFAMPVPSLYPYGQMYYPMSPPVRLPFPAPIPAVYPYRPEPVPMSIPVPVPLQAPLPPAYIPGYVRYPAPIVYSQVIPPLPTVGYQVPQMPNNVEVPYNTSMNQMQETNDQQLENIIEEDNQDLTTQDQTIVYFQNDNYNYYPDNGSECGSSCACSIVSGCSVCVEQTDGDENMSNISNTELPNQSTENIESNEPAPDMQQEPSDITKTSPVIQEQTVTMEKETVSSNDESSKEPNKDSLITDSQTTPSTSDKLVLTKKTSAPITSLQNQNTEYSEQLDLPSTSKSVDNIQTKQYDEAIPKKSVRFADKLPKRKTTTDQVDERMYLRTPTIFEILDARKNMDPEEAERPPTNYMEDVIQRKERRWKQMDKIPGSPRLDTILDMIKKDIKMLEEEEKQEKEEARLKIEAERNARVIELKAADALLQVNIQAQPKTTQINVPTKTSAEVSQSDEPVIYEPIILHEPIVVQPLFKPDETKRSQPKTSIVRTSASADDSEPPEKRILIDDEERKLLNKLANSNRGFKDVWLSDRTVTEMKDKLFEKWCKSKPKLKSRTATTICSQEHLDVDSEQVSTDATDYLPEEEIMIEAKVYDTKEQSTQTNITKPIRPIISQNQQTQTGETNEPEVMSYASVVRGLRK